MPIFFANIIDNPLRRKNQSPKVTAIRPGLRKGMQLIEVGPANSRYTLLLTGLVAAAAQSN
jgi:hypothetical protein